MHAACLLALPRIKIHWCHLWPPDMTAEILAPYAGQRKRLELNTLIKSR